MTGEVAQLVQPFPALDQRTEAALRASIERFGVLVPVVHDQYGRILDGHHRSRIADDLGVDYRVDVRAVADEGEAREIARTLNADRRHLTPEQRRENVKALREEGHSQRAIAGALGVSKKTVQNDIATVQVDTPIHVEGQDGKSYPARRKEEDTNGRRPSKTASFVVRNRRTEIDAGAAKRRLIAGLSQITGLCHGLVQLDYGMAVAAMGADELTSFARQAQSLSVQLRKVKTNLEEASRNGTHA